MFNKNSFWIIKSASSFHSKGFDDVIAETMLTFKWCRTLSVQPCVTLFTLRCCSLLIGSLVALPVWVVVPLLQTLQPELRHIFREMLPDLSFASMTPLWVSLTNFGSGLKLLSCKMTSLRAKLQCHMLHYITAVSDTNVAQAGGVPAPCLHLYGRPWAQRGG